MLSPTSTILWVAPVVVRLTPRPQSFYSILRVRCALRVMLASRKGRKDCKP